MKNLLMNSGIDFDESGFIKIPPWVKRVKLDVGVSDGANQTAKWLDQENDLMVFGFEPNLLSVSKLRRRDSEFSTSLHPKFINWKFFLIECALDNVSEMQEKNFFNTKDLGCSSLLKPTKLEVSHHTKVQTWSLNHFFDLFPFDRIKYIDHIKTDCQGADLEIVKGCSRYLEKIAIFTCEADEHHYYNSTNKLQNLTEYFNKQGFFKYRNYMRKTTKIIGPRLKYIDTEDPTFINRKLRTEIDRNGVRAYQKG